MKPTVLQRRRQLLGLLFCSIPIFWGSTPSVGAACSDDLGPAQRALVSVFSDRRRARSLAQAYRDSTPAERWSAASLTRAILGPTPTSAVAAMTPAMLHHFIAERIRVDFSENNTVCLEGWILSKTEARLCALAALRCPWQS
jgi:hypothetical protein